MPLGTHNEFPSLDFAVEVTGAEAVHFEGDKQRVDWQIRFGATWAGGILSNKGVHFEWGADEDQSEDELQLDPEIEAIIYFKMIFDLVLWIIPIGIDSMEELILNKNIWWIGDPLVKNHTFIFSTIYLLHVWWYFVDPFWIVEPIAKQKIDKDTFSLFTKL